VCKDYPNVHLTILGEGELENTLKKQAIDLDIVDHVSFLGFVDNPYPYYYYSDTYILSSRWEGFPNTLLEALACGTKVVATNCKSGPNEIIGNNEYGILAEVSNIESLSTSIIRSINGSNKSNNRGEHFEVSKIIKEYEKILLKL
jgi:glycosyltransferase involved in cell wall biosynthesis